MPRDQPHNVPARRPQRQTDPELPPPLDSYLGDQTVKAEVDIASQGDPVESARNNLIEALELFFESADPTEVARRLHGKCS